MKSSHLIKAKWPGGLKEVIYKKAIADINLNKKNLATSSSKEQNLQHFFRHQSRQTPLWDRFI
jgi:hypothetical protein